MLDKIIPIIMRHTVLMDKIKDQAKTCYSDALNDRVDLVVLGIENRDRMIKSASKLQRDVTTLLTDANNSKKTDQIDQIISCWSADIQKFISALSRIDEEITSVLTFQKEKTLKQISNIYQEKDRVRRFNLNSVR